MTPAQFNERMRGFGFSYHKSPNGNHFRRDTDGVPQCVARESVRGAAWRVLLARGDIPDVWPSKSFEPTAATWLAAESPWFEYFTDLKPDEPDAYVLDSRESALDKCFDWFETVGMCWLTDPTVKSNDDWRTDDNLLVREHVGNG